MNCTLHPKPLTLELVCSRPKPQTLNPNPIPYTLYIETIKPQTVHLLRTRGKLVLVPLPPGNHRHGSLVRPKQLLALGLEGSGFVVPVL